MKKSLALVFIIALVVAGRVTLIEATSVKFSRQDMLRFHDYQLRVERTPIDSNEYFMHSFTCSGCHGYDPQALAMVDENGTDVNLHDDWQTSMMALSAIDPLWRAKVSHESTVNPGTAADAQDFCTGCHAPMGHYTAHYKGFTHYTIAELVNDSLGLDGVSCNGCHAIGPNGLGSMYSGSIPYDTNNVEYGPFTSPMTGPMDLYVGLTPTYSEHVSQGRFCSPCHTLITNTTDLSGNLTGGTFVEQATYQEWVNSDFPGMNKPCQNCHMTPISDPVVIAVGYLGLPPRTPYNLHHFSGANSFMVNLIKNNKVALGVDAPDVNFDSTLAAITRVLTKQSVDVNILGTPFASNDSLFVDVELTNKAGHKFPTGYPSRRAFVQLVVTDDLTGDTLFRSGLFDQTGEITNQVGIYQPHREMINQENQVQIYEMVMGDVNGDKTTVLERADTQLKDNRIPPLGFTSSHYTYDTVAIIANAFTDPDFNRSGVTEGTGKDQVHFHIPLNGFGGTVNVYTKVYYQTLPPAWLTEMFSFSTPAIDDFRNMYNNEENIPILVSADSIENVQLDISVGEIEETDLILYPNPTANGFFGIRSNTINLGDVTVYDLSGRQVPVGQRWIDDKTKLLQLPERKGTYIVRIKTPKGYITKKVVYL